MPRCKYDRNDGGAAPRHLSAVPGLQRAPSISGKGGELMMMVRSRGGADVLQVLVPGWREVSSAFLTHR